jgi:hypothetical protein
VSIV